MWKDMLASMNLKEPRPAWQAFTYLLRAMVRDGSYGLGGEDEEETPLRIQVEIEPEQINQGAEVARLRAERTGYQARSSELIREAISRGFHAMLTEERDTAPARRPRRRR